MSALLGEIKRINADAAGVLEKADLRSDHEIQSLTRQELLELFPGACNLKLRRRISEVIYKQGKVEMVLQEMKEFVPDEYLRAAFSYNGVLNDYLHILKGLKTQMNDVQMFLDAHIDLLEAYSKTPDPIPAKGFLSSGASTTDSHCCPPPSSPITQEVCINRPQTDGRPQGTQVSLCVVVSGKTFDAHHAILHKVKKLDGFALMETAMQDCRVIIVFCPISSRIVPDVESAMSLVADDKPIILVMMHHTREPKISSYRRPWPDSKNVVLAVNVFFHETVPGLLKCEENEEEVRKIHEALLVFRVERQDNGGHVSSAGSGSDVKSWWPQGWTKSRGTKAEK